MSGRGHASPKPDASCGPARWTQPLVNTRIDIDMPSLSPLCRNIDILSDAMYGTYGKAPPRVWLRMRSAQMLVESLVTDAVLAGQRRNRLPCPHAFSQL